LDSRCERRQFRGDDLATDAQIFCSLFASVRHDVEANLCAFVEAAQASLLDCANVHEYVFAATIGLNKPVALLAVEPLHCTVRHLVVLLEITEPLSFTTTT